MKLIFTRQTKQRQAQLQKAADKMGIARVPEWEITGESGKNNADYWPVTTEEVRERLRSYVKKHDNKQRRNKKC